MDGLFISFEGVDGCGKSTQMRFLGEYLNELGFEPLATREPGGCPVAESVRAILLNPQMHDMDAYTEAHLYAAARAQHVRQVILPALRKGRIVLCDRYIDSSIAYQGYGRELGADTVTDINKYAVGGVMPNCTFFLDVPPRNAFQRRHNPAPRDRIEQQGDAFFERAYHGFLKQCDRYPERIMRVDASGNKHETQERIRRSVKDLLQAEGLLDA